MHIRGHCVTAVLAVNATPVIVDVDAETLCIDLDAVRAALTERTKAVIAVHVAGATADVDALLALCADAGVHLVEDCAHAHGSRWRDRGVGSFGSFGSFSFQETKLMTAGEGGVLLCNDPILVERAESYVNCGRVPGGHWYHHDTYGSNLRMTEWQGAVLTAQLRRYSEQLETRNARAALLARELDAINGVAAQRRDERLDAQGYYYFVFHYHAERVRRASAARLRGCAARPTVCRSACAIRVSPRWRSSSATRCRRAFECRGSPRDSRPARAPSTSPRRRCGSSTARCSLAPTTCERSREAVQRIQRHAVDITLMFGANVAG